MTFSLRRSVRTSGLFLLALQIACVSAQQEEPSQERSDWQHYGNDAGGSRYSPLAEITRDNVASLETVWSIRTGDASHDDGSEGTATGCGRCHQGESKFEATPLMVEGRLLLSTPLNRVIALDPETGVELWRHDPKIDLDISRSEGFVSRGVAHWTDAEAETLGALCATRVFFGTIDARLLALDAESGVPCLDFGEAGTVRLDLGVGEVQIGQYGVTSPPSIVGDIVVVGSAIGDNRRVDMERGTVRAFNARTGAMVWAFDPVPRRADDPGWETWQVDAPNQTGAANAWAPISADPELGLVFIPTGSAAPDFYGGERLGENLFANSVVAIEAETGKIRWHFQAVHHDLWDYDVPAQPTLTRIERRGEMVPAVLVPTKMGFLYVLDRRSGEPLFPIEERSVPASDVPGEFAWPTQPFPTKPPPLHPLQMTEEDVWGLTPEDLEACQSAFQGLRNEGIFTPPSLRGTLMYPGYSGGMTWGGISVDEERGIAVVNQLRLPFWVRLHERAEPGRGMQLGTPYHMTRALLAAPSGLPCSRPPWGVLTAIKLSTGEVAWERPLGVMPGLEQVPGADEFGAVNMGGSLLTGSGLVFIAAAADQKFRAFDVETGDLVWETTLPGGGQATPMTYAVGGKQYIVLAAGGHGAMGVPPADHVVAFALP